MGGNGWWGSPTLPAFPRAIWVKSNFITDFWCKVLLWVGVNPPPTHEDNEKRNDFLSCLGALIDDWWLVAGLWTTVLFLPLKHQNKWQFKGHQNKWQFFCWKKNELKGALHRLFVEKKMRHITRCVCWLLCVPGVHEAIPWHAFLTNSDMVCEHHSVNSMFSLSSCLGNLHSTVIQL